MLFFEIEDKLAIALSGWIFIILSVSYYMWIHTSNWVYKKRNTKYIATFKVIYMSPKRAEWLIVARW